MKPPELLTPAGTFEYLRAACDHGADAVYVGIGRFNLRARSGNFSVEELENAITYVKKNGRRIYAALNIMPGDGVLDQIEKIIQALSACDSLPDALIVSDPGVISLCRQYLNSVPLHLSTQTGTCNYLSARFWQGQGITRIVLPREMTLEEVAAFNKKLPLKPNCSYTGQCAFRFQDAVCLVHILGAGMDTQTGETVRSPAGSNTGSFRLKTMKPATPKD